MYSQSRRDLIVPIRDRRQSRRYLTTRNVLGTFGIAILAFAAITIRSEMQHPSGTYGRLFGEQVQVAAPAPQPVAVVTEGPVPDQTAADPMLVSAGAREQILGVNPQPAAAPAPAPTYAPEPAPIAPASVAANGDGEHARVAIVGGADGVKLVQQDGKRPLLGGGIFKQP
jgi:hypothetical protein